MRRFTNSSQSGSVRSGNARTDARRVPRVRRAMQLLWWTLLLSPALAPAMLRAQPERSLTGRVYLYGVTACQAQWEGPLERVCTGQGTAGEIRGYVGGNGLLHTRSDNLNTAGIELIEALDAEGNVIGGLGSASQHPGRGALVDGVRVQTGAQRVRDA